MKSFSLEVLDPRPRSAGDSFFLRLHLRLRPDNEAAVPRLLLSSPANRRRSGSYRPATRKLNYKYNHSPPVSLAAPLLCILSAFALCGVTYWLICHNGPGSAGGVRHAFPRRQEVRRDEAEGDGGAAHREDTGGRLTLSPSHPVMP